MVILKWLIPLADSSKVRRIGHNLEESARGLLSIREISENDKIATFSRLLFFLLWYIFYSNCTGRKGSLNYPKMQVLQKTLNSISFLTKWIWISVTFNWINCQQMLWVPPYLPYWCIWFYKKEDGNLGV